MVQQCYSGLLFSLNLSMSLDYLSCVRYLYSWWDAINIAVIKLWYSCIYTSPCLECYHSVYQIWYILWELDLDNDEEYTLMDFEFLMLMNFWWLLLWRLPKFFHDEYRTYHLTTQLHAIYIAEREIPHLSGIHHFIFQCVSYKYQLRRYTHCFLHRAERYCLLGIMIDT